MSELTVGARYAKSLIDLAEGENTLDEVKGDMEFFIRVIKANSELYAVLANPIISHEKKIKILDAIFEGKVNQATINFFKIMIDKRRGEVLYYTAQEFINLYNVKKNIIKALVVTATPLSETNKKQFTDIVTSQVGGNIALQTKVNPDLIGGFILTVGDRQIDASIASDLKKLKADFALTAV